MTLRARLLVLGLVLCGCPPVVGPVDAGDAGEDGGADAGVDAGTDAGRPDAGPPPRDYQWTPPDAGVPAALVGDVWKQHWVQDVKPYWMMDEALGTPAGNYPTHRTRRGLPTTNTDRYPRMMGRQIFTYAMGYALTGDEALLERARVGVEWLRTKARDPRGGYYLRLDGTGAAIGTEPKYAQDLSYVMLGYAAWYFVTRDPVAEQELLAGRDLLFDPATYWDAANNRIRDGMSTDLTTEADQSNDDGWELVAQLDPVNAFLGLTQPILSAPARREQLLGDLRTLGQTMVDTFRDPATGIFWGTTTQARYGARHVDWGHSLKTYWMLLQIDKKLPDHPFQNVVLDNAPALLDRAFDAPGGRWGKQPTGPTTQSYGSDWWVYAELDQVTATLNLWDRAHVDRLAQTAGHWRSDWVDPLVGEVISSIRRDGSWASSWNESSNVKCNEWKSGFHSTEHALVMYLTGRDLEGLPAELYFAVPADTTASFIATPYVFSGDVVSREVLTDVTVGARALKKVKVSFQRLY